MISAAQLAAILHLPPPTDEQVAVIEAPLKPVLVVAGAGSGKTETMAARVLFLVANGLVRPDEVLGLTFTRKAASGLATRIRKRLRTLAAAAHTDSAPSDRAGAAAAVSGSGGWRRAGGLHLPLVRRSADRRIRPAGRYRAGIIRAESHRLVAVGSARRRPMGRRLWKPISARIR